jgi:hypothetical protein
MGMTGTVVNRFETYNAAELEKMSTKDLLAHANAMLEFIGEPTVKRFATRAAGIERIERLQRTCSQYTELDDDTTDEYTTETIARQMGDAAYFDGLNGDDAPAMVRVTESYASDDIPTGTPVNVPGFTVAQTDDNEDFVRTARAQLDAWLTEAGYLKPRGGRGRSSIQGLAKTIRSAFPTVGHTLTDAEFRAAVAQYDWADVVRMLARERSDYGKGIQGPVYIARVGETYERAAPPREVGTRLYKGEPEE